MQSAIKEYLNAIEQKIQQGIATEHTHRSTLETLLQRLEPGIRVINEPKRIECGAPDLAVLRDRLMVGHIEAKDVGTPLDVAERSDQLARYRHSLDNLILTDYLEFRWYVNGDHRRTIHIARLGAQGEIKRDKKGIQNLADLLADFLAHSPEPISTPRDLAERMARLTHLIREIIVTAFEKGASGLLTDWRKAFAEVLVADLDRPDHVGQFADMFAQTLAYGLFSARIRHEQGDFTRQKAQYLIPRTNPFLRDFFTYITGPQLDDEPYAGLVEDLVQVLALADMYQILADFGKRTRQDDPTVHFYETFLAAYDPDLRERRGVYYTPNPIVSFIVRSVDILLKTHFRLPDGLADTTKLSDGTHKVLILDPTTGTATFLYHVIDLIREDFMRWNNAGMWSSYVHDHLLPRIFGFELLMAPYAVAHFKLALQLAGHDLPEELQKQWAYDFERDERLQIYLTNALETAQREAPTFWGPLKIVTEEAKKASQVKKDLPIMVVLGNPPYSGHSANQGQWIDDLLHGKLPDGSKATSYYEVDGHPLHERNPKWLQDDYVKFIRFGQWRIQQSGGGVLAYVSNNGYLDNPTFRGMRQSLMETFSEIYLLDLHGNARKRETAPDGSPDENVFDIMQGVAIGLFIKQPGKEELARIYHADLWGSRENKYRLLRELDVEAVEWEELKPQKPFYLFIPQDVDLLGEYQQGRKITDAMPVNVLGFQTHRDHFAIAFERAEILQRVQDLRNPQLTDEELRHKYRLRDNRDWQLAKARARLRTLDNWERRIIECVYRPFDKRYCHFGEITMDYPRRDLVRHVFHKINICLLVPRQVRSDAWRHAGISSNVAESCTVSNKTKEQNYDFPLYLYPDDEAATLFDDTATSPWPTDPTHGNRVPNLSRAFVDDFENKLGAAFEPHKTDNAPGDAFGPRDILAYIYAVFHSPTYRERYAEFLKIDFPRVPVTSDVDLFWGLVELGGELVSLHLMEHPVLAQFITHYPVPGDNRVRRRGGFPKYTPPNPDDGIDGRVWINKEQYFEGVPPDVWEFQVGGYQVLHKWLKDRKGRVLSYDEQKHYQQVVVALKETMHLMDEIDEIVDAHGGWPIE